ncbi:uncharacterized protein N0V89_009213 [Didymosphaeria variabile]|uniref:Uncharacterized protein n=1 Tax=Didymosphaeria variabile TaxID=1932322 RepID=A0A9W8XF38_9PLEO|nr:uncharacterized protein N0V89_009213 [Didymosphaeria variabile]KAJ4347843.1 hypothetical protein N0V89_009213 [Didymosphaeria variabile]
MVAKPRGNSPIDRSIDNGQVSRIQKSDRSRSPSQQRDTPSIAAGLACNASQSMDVTLHLQLEIADDISDDLEEFSRLCRLGNFARASRYLTEHLIGQEQNPYVYVQYAHSLYDSGNYADLLSLQTQPHSTFDASRHGAITQEWKLLKDGATIHSNQAPQASQYAQVCREQWNNYAMAENKSASTQLQTMIISLRNLGYMSRFGAGVDESLVRRAFSLLPLADLMREEKSWDFRDSFVSLVQADPGQELLSDLFGASLPVYLVDTVLKKWEAYAPYSEISTKLAFLDMAESVLFESSPNDESWRLLDKITEIMSSLLQRDGALMKSRQYIRWILLKVAYEARGRREALASTPPGNPGMFSNAGNFLRLLLYAPCYSETPTLSKPKHENDPEPFLKIALDAARAIQDYETEVLCLQALTRFSAEPKAFYDQLAQLQQHTQHDIQGCLRTLLSSYMYCTDEISRAKLKRDITSLGHRRGFLPSLRWTRAMILRSLSVSDVEEWEYFKEAELECMHGPHNLPSTCLAFMTKVSRLSHHKYHRFNKEEGDLGTEKDGFNGYHTTLRQSRDGIDVDPADERHGAKETRSAFAQERNIASERPNTEQPVKQKDIRTGTRHKAEVNLKSPRADIQDQDLKGIRRTKGSRSSKDVKELEAPGSRTGDGNAQHSGALQLYRGRVGREREQNLGGSIRSRTASAPPRPMNSYSDVDEQGETGRDDADGIEEVEQDKPPIAMSLRRTATVEDYHGNPDAEQEGSEAFGIYEAD